MSRPRYLFTSYLALKGIALGVFYVLLNDGSSGAHATAFCAVGSLCAAPVFAFLESLA